MILEFKVTSDPVEDGHGALDRFAKGPAAHIALWDMDQWLRQQVKYAPDDQPEAATDAYQKAREFLWEKLRDEGIDING